jgi:peptide/nickel transport system permease protein
VSSTSVEKEVSVTQRYKRRSQYGEVWRRLKKNKGAMLGLVIVCILTLIAIFADVLMDYDKQIIALNIPERLQSPSWQYLCGTDDMGRDIFLRILYGSRYSLSVGIVAVGISLIIGVFAGAVAAYFGGALEEIIMRITDIFAAIPAMLLAIIIVSILGNGMFNLMLAVGIASVPLFIRITRASVLTVRNQEYIEAARAIGQSNFKIIVLHILPNCLSPIIVQATLRVGSAIIAASSLSFLGLGIPTPIPEWGALLSSGRKFIRDYAYITFFPGLAIMITVIAFNLLGDGLRDALDPKLKR